MSELKGTLRLAFPLILGQLSHIALAIIDNLMVGKLGAAPLAAVSLSNSIFIIPLLFGLGIAFAISPLVANSSGAGEKEHTSFLLTNSFYIVLITGIFIAILTYFGAGIVGVIDQPKEVATLAKPYLQIIGLSAIPALMFTVYKQFSEGLEIMLPALVISLLSIPLNATLNWLLIFGNMGFPEMGLVGAGWATFITRNLMFLSIMVYVLSHKKFAHFHPKRLSPNRLKKVVSFRILRLGLPGGIQYVFEAGAFSFAAIMMGWLGTKELAAHNISISLATTTFMVVIGLSGASAIRIGNKMGRREFIKVKKIGISSLLSISVFMCFTAAIFIYFKEIFPAWHIDDAEVIEISASLIVIAALFQMFDGLQGVTIGILRGMEDVKVPTGITLFAYWVIAVPIGYYLAFKLGLEEEGIWYGLLIGMFVSSIMLVYRFLRLSNRLVKVDESTKEDLE